MLIPQRLRRICAGRADARQVRKRAGRSSLSATPKRTRHGMSIASFGCQSTKTAVRRIVEPSPARTLRTGSQPHFGGALTVAFMMAFVTTFGFTQEPDKVGTALGNVGEARTLGYAAHGAAGMATLFMRGMLCNWMVSTGVVGAMISTTVPGKVIAMWMPILVFFYMVFEHSVVNMFLFPSGLMLHAKFSIMDYFIWNEIPTVLGNLVGGLSFAGLTLYATHVRTAPKRDVSAAPIRAVV
jgi:hypothetical protein